MSDRETQRRLLEIAEELEGIYFAFGPDDFTQENYAGHLFAEAVDLGALKTLPDEAWRDIRKRIHAHRYGSAKPNWGLGAFDRVAREVMEQGWVIDQHQEFICRKVAGLIRQSVDAGKTPSEATKPTQSNTSTRRKKEKGDVVEPRMTGDKAILAALLKHHQYNGNSIMVHMPIGVRELARTLVGKSGDPLPGCSPASVKRYFEKRFNGHAKYEALCQSNGILSRLKLLNGDISPDDLRRVRVTLDGDE